MKYVYFCIKIYKNCLKNNSHYLFTIYVLKQKYYQIYLLIIIIKIVDNRKPNNKYAAFV